MRFHHNWSEEVTKKEKQLGGFRKDGEPYYSIEALRDILKTEFKELQDPVDFPLLLRYNSRTYKYQIAQVTFWQKK